MRIRPILTPLALTALLAACGTPTEKTSTSDNAVVVRETTSPAPPTPVATPVPAAKASEVAEDTSDFTFTYAYPAKAAAIPALATWLDQERKDARASVAKDAGEARRDAAKDDFPFRKYDSTTKWSMVTDTPRFLSLSAETYDYTGGAHGSPGFRAVVWDKQDGQRIAPTDVFASEATLEKLLAAPMCRVLDVERAKRRGAPVVRDDDSFNQCPKVSEATLILGSTNGRAVDRIGLLIGPYVAGSYAEGSYDLTLPVTPAVIAAVKPAYRAAFATR
ncbi:DUF4163 domain-containing protein [Sphingomonas sp. RS2018]